MACDIINKSNKKILIKNFKRIESLLLNVFTYSLKILIALWHLQRHNGFGIKERGWSPRELVSSGELAAQGGVLPAAKAAKKTHGSKNSISSSSIRSRNEKPGVAAGRDRGVTGGGVRWRQGRGRTTSQLAGATFGRAGNWSSCLFALRPQLATSSRRLGPITNTTTHSLVHAYTAPASHRRHSRL